MLNWPVEKRADFVEFFLFIGANYRVQMHNSFKTNIGGISFIIRTYRLWR